MSDKRPNPYIFRMIVLMSTDDRKRISAVLTEPVNDLGQSDRRIEAHLQKMAPELHENDRRYADNITTLICTHTLDWVKWLLFDLGYDYAPPAHGMHRHLPDEIWITCTVSPDMPKVERRRPEKPRN
jgi:hypothetical protein